MEYEDKQEHNRRRNRRGQSDGSRRNRFSKEKQPKRRRQRAHRSSIQQGLLEYLGAPIDVRVNGKAKKAQIFEVLLQSIAHDALKAPLPEKMRFLDKLDKLGISTVKASQARLDEERQEFDDEVRSFREFQSIQQIMIDSARREAAEATAKWYAAARVLRALKSNCDCGACNTFEQDEVDWLLTQIEQDEEAAREHQERLEQLHQAILSWQVEDREETSHDVPDSGFDGDVSEGKNGDANDGALKPEANSGEED